MTTCGRISQNATGSVTATSGFISSIHRCNCACTHGVLLSPAAGFNICKNCLYSSFGPTSYLVCVFVYVYVEIISWHLICPIHKEGNVFIAVAQNFHYAISWKSWQNMFRSRQNKLVWEQSPVKSNRESTLSENTKIVQA